MSEFFDVIVIGGGPSGEHFAGKAAAKGMSVVLVEQELVGGECSYWACMPSKTLLRPAQLLAEVRRVPGVAEAVSGDVDVQVALRRRDWMTSGWNDDGQASWLDGAGVALRRGHGQITGERMVAVAGPDGITVDLVARRAVVVAVGSSASLPPISGLEAAAPWTNREITEAKAAPRRLVIIGGGVVGVEMAQAWKRLGSESVTLLEAGPRLIANLELFAAEELTASLRADGIDVRTMVTISSVERNGADGPITVHFEDARVTADALLVATGRRPRTTALGLEAIGLEPGATIPVDDACRATGVDGGWLYAIGDVNGRALLTHMGKYQGRVVVEALTGGTMRDRADHVAVTGVIFTDPQIATVGRTEQQARDECIDVRVVKADIGSVAAAAIWGTDLAGTCQLVVDAQREVIVGATFVGAPVGELLHAATIAVVGEVPLSTLRHAVAAFPSLSEIWLELIESYFSD